MPTAAVNMDKGPILENFDAYINGPNNDYTPTQRITKAKEIKNMLTTTARLVDIILASGIPLTPVQQNHLRCDWLNETNSGWWGDTDSVLRAGFIESADAVASTGHQVDHHWITGLKEVEVWVRKGVAQIVTIIATPTPP